MKTVSTNIDIKKQGEKFLVSQTNIDEFERAEMEKNVLAKLEGDKKRLEMELLMDDKWKAQIGELDGFKQFVLERVNIRLFSEEEISMKKEQMKLIDGLIKKVKDALI